MADILIRGMEMDGKPHRALFTTQDEENIVIVETASCYDERSVAVYPLVPLPKGHGRLIDADALCPEGEIADDFQRGRADLYDLTVLIEDAPTIVPAEGGGDNA